MMVESNHRFRAEPVRHRLASGVTRNSRPSLGKTSKSVTILLALSVERYRGVRFALGLGGL